jgi:hypothetical protein
LISSDLKDVCFVKEKKFQATPALCPGCREAEEIMQNSSLPISDSYRFERAYHASGDSFQNVGGNQMVFIPPGPQYGYAEPFPIGVALTSNHPIQHNHQYFNQNSLNPTPDAARDGVRDKSHDGRQKRRTKVPWDWVIAILALISLVVTALYASQRIGKLKFITASSSTAILVLRALSELTGLLIAASIAFAFEKLQWLLTVRAQGVSLSEYMAVQAGTGVWGSLLLAVKRGVPRASTRTWSLLRLAGIGIIPAMGILIMSEFPEAVANARQSHCLA